METKLITLFMDYGILGVAVLCLSLYILKLQKDHKAERNIHNTSNQANTDRIIKVISENTSVVSGLKATIDTFITYNREK